MSEPAHPLVPLVTDHRRDLFTWTVDWTARWFDPDESMVWNPPGSFGEPSLARTFHLTPNTAWFAYGALASGRRRPTRRRPRRPPPAARPAVRRTRSPVGRHLPPRPRSPGAPTGCPHLGGLRPQLAPVRGHHVRAAARGPRRPARRGSRRGDRRVDRALRRRRARRPHRRLATPTRRSCARGSTPGTALVTAASDLVARGERFAAEVVALFDRHGAFDEFNSPTYYGIDLLALRLWQTFPPTPWFAEQGARLEAALWASTAAFFNPALGTFAGPFTRAYTPDARRAITVMALWIWADAGRAAAPLPDLDAESIEHGHDLMAGPVIARLAAPDPRFAPLPESGLERRVTQPLATSRTVTTEIGPRRSLGLESSANDWGGWSQFMPLVFHWRNGDDVGSCWLDRPHVVTGTLDGDLVALRVGGVDEIHLLTFGGATIVAPGVVALGDHARLTVTMSGEPLDVDVDADASSRGAVRRLAIRPDADGAVHLRFEVVD